MNTWRMAEMLRQERQRLEERLGRLRARAVLDLRSSIGELSGYDNHPADIGSETFERSRDLRMLMRTRQQIRDIERAQERMARGIYGLCQDCGHPIDPARLEARPDARRCANCAHGRRDVPHIGPEYNPQRGPREGWPDGEPGEEPPLFR